MKALETWIKTHRLLTAVIVLLQFTFAVWLGWSEIPEILALLLILGSWSVAFAYVYYDIHRLLSVVVAAAMFFAPMQSKARERTEGLAVGVVVVVIATVAAIFVVKWCKKSPKPRELPPEEEQNVAGYELVYAASTEGEECEGESAIMSTAPVGTVEVNILPDGTTSIVRYTNSFTASEAATYMQQFGLVQHTESHSFMGVPITADKSPVSFGWTNNHTLVTIQGNALRTVALQSSTDLTNWTTILTITLPSDKPIRFYDTDDKVQKIYRAVR